MNNLTRTQLSKRNFSVSVGSRLVVMIANFVSRTVFVRTIGAEYLGLGGFFGNIFSLLSLCELGFGAAVCQTLYKPIAQNDEYAVSGIMAFYAKISKIIASVILVLSIFVIPFMDKLVKSKIDISQIICAYILFCLHGFVSYLLVPKKMLVICDQRLYVVAGVRCVFSVISLVIQCMVLVKTGNYLVYLCARIMLVVFEDLLVNAYADKKYHFLSVKNTITTTYKNEIYSKVKALVFHKSGGVLSRCTDSLLISFFAGLHGMAKYSNYALVIGTIAALFDVAVNSLSASIGNLGASEGGKKSEMVMRRLYFINFCLVTVCCSVIVSTLNQIIELWMGKEMVFSDFEMLIIVASFYFSCIRDPVQIFVSSFGLFRQSRMIPIFRAILNLVFSVFFIRKIGIAGVFLGTVLSTVFAPLPWEVYVLYKYGFKENSRPFQKEMAGYIGFSFMSCAVGFYVTYKFPQSISGIVFRMITSVVVFCVLVLIMYSNSQHLKFAVGFLKNFFAKNNKKV